MAFPFLGVWDPLVKRAISEYRGLTRIEDEQEAYIGCEERMHFPRIQAVATKARLERIDRPHGLLNGH